MAGIGIVTNPNSRRNRRHPERVERLGYILGQHDHHETTRGPDDVRGVAERFKEAGVEILALNGGDGTNHVTLTTFIEVYGDTPLPMIAFLRGGTMNTISNAVGIRGTPGQILLNIAEKYHLGQEFEVTERNILRVDGDDKTHYGFIFANGFLYNFLEVYYADPNPSPLVAAKVLTRLVGASLVGAQAARDLFRPFRAQVEVDGERWPQEQFTAVVASSIEQIGLGFRPFIRCRQRPDHFNLLGILAAGATFALELPRIRLGMPIPESKMRNEVAREVRFQSDQPIEYTIDGDLHVAEGPVRLSAGPRLRLIIR